VGAEAVRQLAHALDCFLTALADGIGRAELPREFDAVGVAAEDDDLLGAEALGGDHAAQADGAVADDGDGLARPHVGAERGMVACRHHVAECEQRRHQSVVSADGQHHEGAVRLGDTNRLALAPVDAVDAVASSVEA